MISNQSVTNESVEINSSFFKSCKPCCSGVPKWHLRPLSLRNGGGGVVPVELTLPAVYSLKWSVTPSYVFIEHFLCWISPFWQETEKKSVREKLQYLTFTSNEDGQDWHVLFFKVYSTSRNDISCTSLFNWLSYVEFSTFNWSKFH